MVIGFYLILIFLKISILSSIYAAIWLLISIQIGNTTQNVWFQIQTRKKLKYWFFSGMLISLTLFLYSISYWGDRGAGDFQRIPLGSGLVVESIDGFSRVEGIRTSDYQTMEVDKFKIEEGKVVGVLQGLRTKPYFILDMDSRQLKEFHSEAECMEEAEKEGLSNERPLESYEENYRQYWGGLKNWLLP